MLPEVNFYYAHVLGLYDLTIEAIHFKFYTESALTNVN